MSTQVLVIMVGHNASGKTTIASRLQKDLGLNVVEGDPFRMFLSKEIPYFNNLNISFPNPRASIASSLTHQYRNSVTRHLLKAGENVLYCAGNLSKNKREKLFNDICADTPNVTRVIVLADANEETILQRLKNREKNAQGSQWVEHYYKYRKPAFEKPTSDECDALIIYTQNNYDEVKQELEKIIAAKQAPDQTSHERKKS